MNYAYSIQYNRSIDISVIVTQHFIFNLLFALPMQDYTTPGHSVIDPRETSGPNLSSINTNTSFIFAPFAAICKDGGVFRTANRIGFSVHVLADMRPCASELCKEDSTNKTSVAEKDATTSIIKERQWLLPRWL